MKQTTLSNKVSCSGIGLHTGRVVKITLYPAEPNTGVVFKRLDVEQEKSLIPARYDAVCETRLGTTIRNRSGITVSTIEHLMAALWGANVDNVLVELDGPEVPIMDGSSEPFTFMIECARVVEQKATRRILRVLKAVEVQEGKSTARVQPNFEGDEGCVLGVQIEFDSKVISSQVLKYDFRDVTFKQTLSRARTFGFEHEVEAMRANGLALGGSLANAIVVGKDKILNEEGLRYADEFVRHKALDCLGDLFLAGLRIDGRFDFLRPGHGINNSLLRALFADKSAYVITPADALPAPVVTRPAKDIAAYAQA